MLPLPLSSGLPGCRRFESGHSQWLLMRSSNLTRWFVKEFATVAKHLYAVVKSLTLTVQIYYTTRKVLLAEVEFTARFCQYQLGWLFIMRIYHSSLKWLMKIKYELDNWPNGWMSLRGMISELCVTLGAITKMQMCCPEGCVAQPVPITLNKPLEETCNSIIRQYYMTLIANL